MCCLVADVDEWIASGFSLVLCVSPEFPWEYSVCGNCSWCSLYVLVSNFSIVLGLVLVRYFLIDFSPLSTVWITFFFLFSFWVLVPPEFWKEGEGEWLLPVCLLNKENKLVGNGKANLCNFAPDDPTGGQASFLHLFLSGLLLISSARAGFLLSSSLLLTLTNSFYIKWKITEAITQKSVWQQFEKEKCYLTKFFVCPSWL